MPVEKVYREVGLGYLGVYSKDQVAGHMVTNENLVRMTLLSQEDLDRAESDGLKMLTFAVSGTGKARWTCKTSGTTFPFSLQNQNYKGYGLSKGKER